MPRRRARLAAIATLNSGRGDAGPRRLDGVLDDRNPVRLVVGREREHLGVGRPQGDESGDERLEARALCLRPGWQCEQALDLGAGVVDLGLERPHVLPRRTG